MNLLIVANHYAVCSARYATAAFERLGHTVRHVGPRWGCNIWGLTLPERYVWEPDELPRVPMMVATPSDFFPDLIVFMDSDPAILDDVQYQGWRNHSVPAIVWGVDNHVRDYRRPYFKHYFLAHSNVSVMAWDSKDIGGYPMWDRGDGFAVISLSKDHLDMTHLPCCYDPTLHTPSPIPFEQREYDVCMIGYMYPQRWRVVKALRKAGFKVLAGCGLVYENYVSAYHNARISLCISANKDVALRVIETARMGCVVLTDPCPDYQLLKPNGFYLLDSTESMEVVQAVKDVLREPEQAQAMIAQSMAWAEPYSWDHAAKKVEEWYDEHYCMELAQ